MKITLRDFSYIQLSYLKKQEYKGVKYIHIKDFYQLVFWDKKIKGLNEYQHDFHMYDDKNSVLLPYHKVNMRFIQFLLINWKISKGNIVHIDEVMYLLSTGRTIRDDVKKG